MKIQVWGADKAVHEITIGALSHLERVANHFELSTNNDPATDDKQTFLFGLDGAYYGYRDKLGSEMHPFHIAIAKKFITRDHFP